MNAAQLREELQAKGVTLVAVSKMQPIERILELYRDGQRIFGENRVQELIQKYEALPKDIEWHQIGHLQRNKVKYIAPFVKMIHAVDDAGLLTEIEKQAARNNRVIDCLLQFHIAQEETKFGLSLEDAIAFLETNEWQTMQYVRICGVMGMATFTTDQALVQQEFSSLKQIYHALQQRFFSARPEFKELSMGMSGDWQVAVASGSTMVRVGSLLFS